MRFNYKFENKKGMKPYQYSYGKIYKIISPHTDKIYIGSTIRDLDLRFNEHIKDCKIKNLTSSQIFKHGDCEIELIEEYPCDNKKELDTREKYHIQNSLNCINILMKRTNDELSKEIKKCICGSNVQSIGLNKHIKSKKHQEYIKNN